jgi:SAM-dependent methyltransferase
MHGRIIEAEHLARYAWAAQLANGRRALDAACGRAYGSAMLLAAGASEVIGIDLDEEVIAEVREEAPPNARFDVGDLRELPYKEDEFDMVTCFEAIEHVRDPDVVLDELRRVLKPDGVLAISTPNRNVYAPGNPFHLRELTPNELEAALGKRFEHVLLRRQHTWVASGIFDDDDFRRGKNERLEAIELRKACEDELDAETYTLALASQASLPLDRGLVTLTGDVDLREWGERLDIAAASVAGKEEDADLREHAEIESLRGEIDELRTQLIRGEAEIEQYVELGAKLDAAAGALREYETIITSASWRYTRPFRQLAARLRALHR